jgi:uncharacterized protein YukE
MVAQAGRHDGEVGGGAAKTRAAGKKIPQEFSDTKDAWGGHSGGVYHGVCQGITFGRAACERH